MHVTGSILSQGPSISPFREGSRRTIWQFQRHKAGWRWNYWHAANRNEGVILGKHQGHRRIQENSHTDSPAIWNVHAFLPLERPKALLRPWHRSPFYNLGRLCLRFSSIRAFVISST